jgi:membrane-associated phospholipid phosphatase
MRPVTFGPHGGTSPQIGLIMSMVIDRYRAGPRRRARPRPAALELLEERRLLSVGGRPPGIWEARGWRATVSAKPAIISASATPAVPVPVTLHLASSSAPAGDYVDVASSSVVLTGQTKPGATVWLGRTLASGKQRKIATTHADAQGAYQMKMQCAIGTTEFTAQVVSPGGAPRSAGLSVTRSNQAIVWNSIALEAVRNAKEQAPDSSRVYAIVTLSVYDAVNAINPKYAEYGGVTTNVSPGTSAAAAAAAAAETALAALFPSQSAMLGAELTATLAATPEGRGRNLGIALGISVANQILTLRSHDGASEKVNYVPGTGPGDWVPTPPAYASAVDPDWGNVTPFALTGASQFQPPPPPAITSAQYAQEVSQVESVGGTTSAVRTADQTALARFWSDLPGTFDPPGHWNQITAVAAQMTKSNLENSARAFALVDIALADAGIEAWQIKYMYNTVRPVTVIRDGAGGVNPLITADPTWSPLWNTPAFPSYISGHSTFSASAAAALDSLFGSGFPFSDAGDPTENLAPRHFSSFDLAAQEAGMSRIYGGIHFMSDNTYGLQVGGEVGQYVAQHELLPLPSGKQGTG